jgi:hypothetical protein
MKSNRSLRSSVVSRTPPKTTWKQSCQHKYDTFVNTVPNIILLGKWPTWRTILYHVFIFIFNSLHVPSTSCSSSGETNCVNTTSGNCHSVSVTVCCDGKITLLPSTRHSHQYRVTVTRGYIDTIDTCTRHSHRYRVTVTRGCIDTISLSWRWARCARNM